MDDHVDLLPDGWTIEYYVEVRKMKEVAVLISEKDFREELKKLKKEVQVMEDRGNTYGETICYLAGRVSSGTQIHTPEQLRQIINLAGK